MAIYSTNLYSFLKPQPFECGLEYKMLRYIF